MKKCILSVFIIAMCCLLILPMTVSARNYTVSGTDLTVKIDDDYWYVFTRDNLKNNPELDELGVSYSDVYTNMMNNKIYIDAILYYESGSYIELFVRKTNIDKIVNLSNYDDDEVLELAEKLADKYNAREYSVYKSKYKFMKLEYTDLGFYICEYVTVVNGENYTFTFQSTDAYTNSKYNEIETIVDSARFDIDTSLKESGDSSLWTDLFEKFIIGAVVAGLVGGISLLIDRKKNNDTTDNEEKPQKKKDRRGIKRTFAVILLVCQGLGLIGYVINGELEKVFTSGIGFFIGTFAYSIVAVLLFVSANKETKRIEEEKSEMIGHQTSQATVYTANPVEQLDDSNEA